MKRVIIAMLLLTPITVWGQETGQLTTEEKLEISAYLENSWEHLEHLIENLTKEKWNYKTADSIWSIAEISEHLEKSENELFSLVSDQLTHSPPDPGKASEVRNTTKSVLEAVTSRDHKIKTTPNLEPTGYYDSPQQFLRNFNLLREKTLQYAQTTEDELRHHFIPFGPLGDLDGYQILMFMSGHLERHIQQIEEVMANPSYLQLN